MGLTLNGLDTHKQHRRGPVTLFGSDEFGVLFRFHTRFPLLFFHHLNQRDVDGRVVYIPCLLNFYCPLNFPLLNVSNGVHIQLNI